MPTVKEESIHLIQSLPCTVNWDAILYEIYVKMKTKRGMQDIEKGRTFSHEEVMKMFGI